MPPSYSPRSSTRSRSEWVPPEAVAVRAARDAVSHLLAAADEDHIAEYTRHLTNTFGIAIEPESVLELIQKIVQNDHVADAIDLLRSEGRVVRRIGEHLIHVYAKSSRPELVALNAIGHAEDCALVGAWCTTPTGKGSLVLWRSPDLAVITGQPKSQLWRHYRVSKPIGPKSLASQRGFDLATEIKHGPRQQPFALAVDLMTKIGLDRPEPPEFDIHS